MKDFSKQILNLKPIQKGEVRNPNGRPAGSQNRRTLARKFLDAQINYTDPTTNEVLNVTAAEMLILTAIRKGANGDIPAIALLLDSGYGKQGTGGDTDNYIPTYNEYDITLLPDDKLRRLQVLRHETQEILNLCRKDPNSHIEALEITE